MTPAPTPAVTPAPTPAPEPGCESCVYKKQCEDSGRPFAVFTPYPDNWDGVCGQGCLADQPCQLPCADTGCTVSAFVRTAADGKRAIEYFVVGPSEQCAEQIRALSFASNNTVEYDRQCIARIDKMHCGHIAPYESRHRRIAERPWSSESSESSGSSSNDDDAHEDSLAELSFSDDASASDRCVVKEDWCPKQRQARFLITLKPGFRGVVIEVPHDFVVEVEPVQLLRADGSNYRCSKACVLNLPVPKCGNSRCDSDSSSGAPDLCGKLAAQHHDRHATPRPVVFTPPQRIGLPTAPAAQPLGVAQRHSLAGGAAGADEAAGRPAGRCEAPPSIAIAAAQAVDAEHEPRLWLAALEEQDFALAHCPRAPAPDSTELFSLAIGLHESAVGNCDLQRCRAALLHRSRLTGERVPTTAAGFIARARALATAGREALAADRHNEARQAACCADLLFESMLREYGCAVEHCDAMHFYPSNAVFERASDDRKRAVLRPQQQQQQHASAAAVHAAQRPDLTYVAFEECDFAETDFVADNDANDAIFAVYATSMVGALTKKWFASALHFEVRAIGSTSDFALEMRLADAHIPPGSRIRVLHHGVGAPVAEECWIASASEQQQQQHAHECASTDVLRLVRSTRTALPHHPASRTPFVNTLAGTPLADAAYIVSVYIDIPAAAALPHALPALRLALELRDRATGCTVRTNRLFADGGAGSGSSGGFGVFAPAPFAWPTEGVPAFLNATALPSGGLCIGGDRARARCNEADECAGGYCEMREESGHAHHCYDAPLPGYNDAALCSRASQCPYGSCYGRDGQRGTEAGAYPLLYSHLESPSPNNAHWFKFVSAVNDRTLYDADAHRMRAE